MLCATINYWTLAWCKSKTSDADGQITFAACCAIHILIPRESTCNMFGAFSTRVKFTQVPGHFVHCFFGKSWSGRNERGCQPAFAYLCIDNCRQNRITLAKNGFFVTGNHCISCISCIMQHLQRVVFIAYSLNQWMFVLQLVYTIRSCICCYPHRLRRNKTLLSYCQSL